MDFGPPSNEEINFSLNFTNLCDNLVKKLVSEVRKCHQFRPSVSLTIICGYIHVRVPLVAM